jgi:hypothetical protein
MWPEKIWSLHIFVNVLMCVIHIVRTLDCTACSVVTWVWHANCQVGHILHVRKNELLIKQNISDGQATLSVKERASETAVLAGDYGYVSVCMVYCVAH